MLTAYAVIVLLQEVTTIVSHTVSMFVYIQYPQECNTLSMMWFSLKSYFKCSKQLIEHLNLHQTGICPGHQIIRGYNVTEIIGNIMLVY